MHISGYSLCYITDTSNLRVLPRSSFDHNDIGNLQNICQGVTTTDFQVFSMSMETARWHTPVQMLYREEKTMCGAWTINEPHLPALKMQVTKSPTAWEWIEMYWPMHACISSYIYRISLPAARVTISPEIYCGAWFYFRWRCPGVKRNYALNMLKKIAPNFGSTNVWQGTRTSTALGLLTWKNN